MGDVWADGKRSEASDRAILRPGYPGLPLQVLLEVGRTVCRAELFANY